MGVKNNFPINTTKLTELPSLATPLDTDVFHIINSATNKKIAFSDIKSAISQDVKPSNTIIVSSEADFGTASGGFIDLADDTTYIVSGQILVSNQLRYTGTGSVAIKAQSIAIGEIVYLGNDTLFTLSNYKNFFCQTLSITGATGLATLFNSTGNGIVNRGDLFFDTCTITNFTIGAHANSNLLNLRQTFFFQTSGLVLDNVFAFTCNQVLTLNVLDTNNIWCTIKTNLNQANISACAFIPQINEHPFKIDPAITATSGISFGPAVPYQGFQINPVASFSDGGGGTTLVTMQTGNFHNLNNGDLVTFLVSQNYSGGYIVSDATAPTATPSTFKINTPFIGDDVVTGNTLCLLLDLATGAPKITNFFAPGVQGSVTSITDSGGLALVTSTAHGLTTGQSLYLTTIEGDYDAGYYVVVVDVNSFTLLNSSGIPVNYTVSNTTGTWDTKSLDQTNSVITIGNAGGILPDSSTVASITHQDLESITINTTFQELNLTGWLLGTTERFKTFSTGYAKYTGKTSVQAIVSGTVTVATTSGTVACEIGLMIKRVSQGETVFTELSDNSTIRASASLSTDPTSIPVPDMTVLLDPLDELKFGIVTDNASGKILDITTCLLLIRKV